MKWNGLIFLRHKNRILVFKKFYNYRKNTKVAQKFEGFFFCHSKSRFNKNKTQFLKHKNNN